MPKKEKVRDKYWDEKNPKNDLDFIEVSLPEESVDAFIQHYAHESFLNKDRQTSQEKYISHRKKQKLVRKVMKAASETLTDRQFQIFMLRHVAGLKEDDIASQADVDQSYVSAVLHTSYAKIKKILRLNPEK